MKGETRFGLTGAPLQAINGVARFVFYISAGAAVVLTGILVYNYLNGGANAELAVANAKRFGDPALMSAVIACLVGLWLYWEEEVYGPILLILGAAVYFSPLYLPGMSQTPAEQVLDKILPIAFPTLLIGLIAVSSDVTSRIMARVKLGKTKEKLRYGQGVKEETGYRNVFMGKCWQLPYCRKYVRDKCPIYHAKASCWKERAGCMCEERIVANALDDKFKAPESAQRARALIPKSSLLSPAQKRDRCGSCIIFNHHQKQKYKAVIPVIFISGFALFFALRTPLNGALEGAIRQASKLVSQATLSATEAAANPSYSFAGVAYSDMILAAGAFLAVVYAIKMAEHMIFDLNL
jgi:hypothetical protein